MKPCVFIHTNQRQYIGALVSAHSMKRNSRHSDEFDVQIINHRDYSFFLEHEGEPYLRDGHRQKYALSVAGGGQALQYFISGQYDDNKGVLPLDTEQKAGLRGNFTFAPLSNLNVQVSSGYTRIDMANTPAGNNAQGLILNAFRRERNYFSNGDPDTIRLVLNQENNTRIDRFILGTTLNYQPNANWMNRLHPPNPSAEETMVSHPRSSLPTCQVRPPAHGLVPLT